MTTPRPKSCCRSRSMPIANPRDFCATLNMATPILVTAEGPKLTATVMVPGGQMMPLGVALTHYGCKENSTTGIQLASLVVRGLEKAAARGMQGAVTVGRNVPLLMLKDQLRKLAGSCAQCHGVGCSVCGMTGFR